MQQSSTPVTGYPVQNANGCAPPPPAAASGTAYPASWNAEFRVSNPNKKLSINYGDVISSVFHGDHYLAETRIGPFSQGTGDVRTLDASYSVVDSFVYGRVVDAMNGERRCGQVRFNVKAVADMAFRYGGWRGRWRLLRVWSDDITLTGSPGKMIGGSKRCTVG
ncbi:hypothetical protein HRI_003397300 [Hibiscus trionum]|uniref:Late embryogenesis abundant protein LEA-2 subgroup domain-containing protein n=1 Tax=Hibiscus trionum TaxID=183268 RepID=A0A9W7MEJ3_HIBTR|nr:hypothetical protein HRI_003397300 [Hibiscus trionum]